MASLNCQVNHPIDLKAECILNRKTIQELSVAQSMHLVILNISFCVLYEEIEGLMRSWELCF